MNGRKNGIEPPDREIRLLRRKLDRARAALGKTVSDKRESELRQEVNDVTSRLGWTLCETEQYDEALTVYETLDRSTHGEDRYIGITRVLIERERYEEAAELLDEALERYPESCCLMNNKGLLHYSSGDPYEALRWFDRALTHAEDEESMAAAFNRGLVLIELGLFEDASIVYERLLEHDPRKPEYVYEYAYCNHKRGQLWEAIRLYRMCLQLGCETPGVYAGLCSAFGEAGLFAEGAVAGLHGLNKYPDVEAMYENLGEVHLDMGRLDDAEEVLTKGMGKFPESEAIQALLDRLEQEREQEDDESETNTHGRKRCRRVKKEGPSEPSDDDLGTLLEEKRKTSWN